MPNLSTFTIVFIKSVRGHERSLADKLGELLPSDGKRCSFCKCNGGTLRCTGMEMIALGSSTGRFDFCAVVAAPDMHSIHDVVIDCLRGDLDDHVLDTESTFLYNLPMRSSVGDGI